MVMFLDQKPDPKRLALAGKLGVAVVAETKAGSFKFCEGSNGEVVDGLFT